MSSLSTAVISWKGDVSHPVGVPGSINPYLRNLFRSAKGILFLLGILVPEKKWSDHLTYYLHSYGGEKP